MNTILDLMADLFSYAEFNKIFDEAMVLLSALRRSGLSAKSFYGVNAKIALPTICYDEETAAAFVTFMRELEKEVL